MISFARFKTGALMFMILLSPSRVAPGWSEISRLAEQALTGWWLTLRWVVVNF
jgi:hypothetical protein